MLVEMRKTDARDIKKFGTLDSNEKTTIGDRWPQTAKQEGDKLRHAICFTDK